MKEVRYRPVIPMIHGKLYTLNGPPVRGSTDEKRGSSRSRRLTKPDRGASRKAQALMLAIGGSTMGRMGRVEAHSLFEGSRYESHARTVPKATAMSTLTAASTSV